MRFAILGPLEIMDDGDSQVAVSRRLHRSTLCLLLLNAGQPCSVNGLISALWSDSPPLSPEVSLRSCVYGIRKLLPDGRRLVTHPSGYLMQVNAGELDLHSFRDLVSRGRDALDSGNPLDAATLLDRALSLWRDPPVADLPESRDKEKLLDQRKEAQDALMDARLALGRHRQVLSELRSLVTADPLREHAWAQLMTALYRCGARAEALAAFGRLRMTLVTTYGIEPGPELQDLHRKVLADDPVLMPALQSPVLAMPVQADLQLHSGTALTAVASPVPQETPRGWPDQVRPACQLPASVADFAGRAAELKELLNRLPAEGMAVTVLSGMPGAGKTELAVHAAHLARPAFPDGQLCAWLDDSGLARDPQVVLGELLRGLGVPAGEIPLSRFEREAMYRSVLAGRRVLVLIDGATSAAQVRPLLPSTAGSAALVTSRSRLADLDGAKVIELNSMQSDDAISLLAGIAAREPTPANLEAASAIAASCGYLPLAIRIAGARLADDPDLPMPRLAELLASEGQRLDELSLGDQSVRARLAAAAQTLSGTAKTVLALLSAAGQRDAPGWLIASLVEDQAGGLVAQVLAGAGLLQRVPGSGVNGATYRMHPLVRSFAAELLAEANPGIVGAATGRLLASGWLELANGSPVAQSR
ncbi:MAG TPA: BTAD domain-containing putative transcriptional regulator [Streptosporangiaceae bacterium]|nr:BTAD domain-containing putative transcriptional regulator [Streptosporangiaceae bacterium]